MSEAKFTAVFDIDIRQFAGNPLKTGTPFGSPSAVGIGDAFREKEELHDRACEAESAISKARAEGRREGLVAGAAMVAVAPADMPRHKLSARLRRASVEDAAHTSASAGDEASMTQEAAGAISDVASSFFEIQSQENPMKDPMPINETSQEDVRKQGWMAEARDADGHVISVHAPFDSEADIASCVREWLEDGNTVTIWPHRIPQSGLRRAG